MESLPEVDEQLIAKTLAELADGDYQAHVWAGRVPTVSSSLVSCYAALFGESGLSDALASGPVFAGVLDDELLELRELLEAVDDRRPIDVVLRDPRLAEARRLAGDILTQLGVTQVIKRGRPELDAPLRLPGLSRPAKVALASLVAVTVVVAAIIVFQPAPRCLAPDTGGAVTASTCR